jgi:protein TonB
LKLTGSVEWRCVMTRSYSAGASRRTAVFTAIIGFHFATFLLIAAGLVPRIIQEPRQADPPEVTLLPPEKKPVEAVPPEATGPLEYVAEAVAEPRIPRITTEVPDISTRVVDPGPGGVDVAEHRARSPLVAPYLRMRNDRLAALINRCYPAASRRAGEEGRATVQLLIGNDGSVRNWRLVQGTGFARVDAALGCIIDNLAIEPGRQDGRAVESEVMLPVIFRLD